MSEENNAPFKMVKIHHAHTLEKAIQEEKIDPLMIPFARHVAQTKDYFTTSTCSGRITLMDLPENEEKRPGAFYRKWHRTVNKKEVEEGIATYSNNRNLWLKQDAFVYVIGTHSIEKAQLVLHACQEAGVKRVGIHYIGKGKILIEIFGTHRMNVPLILEGKKIADADYIQKIIPIANRKLKQNETKRKILEKFLRKAMKK
ncbi:MAG: hypothetical protein V1776_02230 [Candidatus Diapherotrites archaeon]